MNPSQREDMTTAILDATIPLHKRIAELEKDLADAQEQLQELAPMRPVLEHLREVAFNTPHTTGVDTPKALSINGMTLWGAGPRAAQLLHLLLWAARNMIDQRKV